MNSGAAYTATDLYPYSGYSYYRLKMQDADGSFSSSETIRIKTDQKMPVSPNYIPILFQKSFNCKYNQENRRCCNRSSLI